MKKDNLIILICGTICLLILFYFCYLIVVEKYDSYRQKTCIEMNKTYIHIISIENIPTNIIYCGDFRQDLDSLINLYKENSK